MLSNTSKLQNSDLHSSSPVAVTLKTNKTKFGKRQSGSRVGHEDGVGRCISPLTLKLLKPTGHVMHQQFNI